MALSWKDLTFVPTQEALAALRENWCWLLPDDLCAFMAASSGDLFFEASDGSIHWLDTGRGELSNIAPSRDAFLVAMRADDGTEWLMTPLIEQLMEAGAELEEGQCFAYTMLPILGGGYTPDNMVPRSAVEWYGFSGWMHQQLSELPDGSQVRLSVGE